MDDVELDLNMGVKICRTSDLNGTEWVSVVRKTAEKLKRKQKKKFKTLTEITFFPLQRSAPEWCLTV